MICWHYTTGERFTQIVEAGYLVPTRVGIGRGEKPINWFSVNAYWELTANKGIVEKGRRRSATMEEMRQLGRGLVRFGLQAKKLTPWPAVGKKAGMTKVTISQLEIAAKDVGGVPREWYGTLKPVAVHDLIVEVIDESGAWQRVSTPET